MRPIVFFGVWLVVGMAAAQARGPSISSLTGDLSLHAAIQASREHGCSRSWENSTATTDAMLTVRGGRAELHLSGTHRSIGGSHPGLGGGGGGIHEVGEAIDATYRGTATVAHGELAIQFVDGDVASSRWSGPGSLPLGASAREPFAVLLRCAIEPADVAAGSTTAHVPLAHCRWDDGGSGSGAALFTGYDFWLGRGAGIDVASTDSRFGEPSVAIRAL